MAHSSPSDHRPSSRSVQDLDAETFLGQTSLKWTANGELSDHDFHEVLLRLCQADEQTCRILTEDTHHPR